MLIVFHGTVLAFYLKTTTKQINTEVFLKPLGTKNLFFLSVIVKYYWFFQQYLATRFIFLQRPPWA